MPLSELERSCGMRIQVKQASRFSSRKTVELDLTNMYTNERLIVHDLLIIIGISNQQNNIEIAGINGQTTTTTNTCSNRAPLIFGWKLYSQTQNQANHISLPILVQLSHDVLMCSKSPQRSNDQTIFQRNRKELRTVDHFL